ncbi:MAG: Flp pilus assembly complex ATPase component TadA [Myxococcales bacterium]|nr:Flp pilus assembly complex ATPase component TadA [Myxococcales bacterium]
MFSIIISEKGGAERRESFDKTEINVGRVQGNDLMLPKGNVSKRHARLLFRDGRFIVTDLKSTNGTYVNGRKIAQATIVREGDKIYIGDFVLRIELSQEQQAAAGAAPPSPPSMEESGDGEAANADRGGARIAPPPLPGAPTAGPPPMPGPSAGGSGAMPMPMPPAVPSGGMGMPAPARETALGPGPTAPPLGGAPMAPGPMQGPVPAPQPPAPITPQPVPPTAPPPMAPPMAPPQAPAMVAPAMVPQQMAPQPPPMMPQAQAIAPPPMAPPQAPAMVAPAMVAPAMVPQQMAGMGSPAGMAPAVPQPPPITTPPPAPPPVAPSPPAMVTPLPSNGPGDGAVMPSANAPMAPPAMVPSGPGAARPEMAKISAPPPPTSAPSSSNPAQQSPVPASSSLAASGQAPRSSVRNAAASEGVVDASQAAAHRAALAKLVERLASAIDLTPLSGGDVPSGIQASIDRALAEAAASMRTAGELPAGLDPEVLVGEARRELLDLGPIGPLLEDEYVEEVQVIRHDHVVAMHGKKQVATEIAFTSEDAVARVLRRLCQRAGTPLGHGEAFVDRRLQHGARLFGVVPPASGDSHMLVIRKPHRALSSLDDMVRAGTLSRAMATLLAQAVQGRANVLVTGAVGNGASSLVGALAGAGNIEDRVVVLQEDDELIFNQPHTVSMLIGDTSEEGARAVRAAIRVRPDRLVVGAFAGHVVAEVVDAIGDGVDGVLAAARAPTLRHLASRLPADLAATRAGLALDTAREWLASSFDLVLEVARLRDGRHRVMRLAEFTLDQQSPLGLRDVFSFTVERTAAGGAVEGSFHATGVVPRLAEDLVARGVAIDLSIFKRQAR